MMSPSAASRSVTSHQVRNSKTFSPKRRRPNLKPYQNFLKYIPECTFKAQLVNPYAVGPTQNFTARPLRHQTPRTSYAISTSTLLLSFVYSAAELAVSSITLRVCGEKSESTNTMLLGQPTLIFLCFTQLTSVT